MILADGLNMDQKALSTPSAIQRALRIFDRLNYKPNEKVNYL